MTPPAVPFGGKHVLFVDDETALLVPMRRYFERLGAAVTVAQARESAAALITPGGFDLIVLDLMLGGDERDGIEVLQAARQRSGDTPVIVLSGLVTPELQRELSDLGAEAVLTKPQTLQELARVARTLMGLPEAP
jgi:CheY-like chemotaxis protein